MALLQVTSVSMHCTTIGPGWLAGWLAVSVKIPTVGKAPSSVTEQT